MADKHITEINKTLAQFVADADNGQCAQLTDQNNELIYRIGTDRFLVPPARKTTNGSDFTYLDAEFDDLYAQGNMKCGEYFYHYGDADTYDRWEADKKSTVIGGVEFIAMTEDTQDVLEFNSANGDMDIIFNTVVTNTLVLAGDTGRIGIGTASPAAELEMAKAAANQSFFMTCYSDTLGDRNYIQMRKSDSDVLGTLVHTHNNSYLFELVLQGVKSDDSAFATGAKMIVQAVGDAGANYVGAKILFTTGTNATAQATRFSIGDAGQITAGEPDTADAVPLLRVWGGTAGGSCDSPADTLVTFEDSGDLKVQLLGPATAIQTINFGDVNDVDIGHIAYSHGTDLMYFGANNTEIMTLSATVLNIAGTVQCDTLQIDTAFVGTPPTVEGYFHMTVLVCGVATAVHVPCEVPA